MDRLWTSHNPASQNGPYDANYQIALRFTVNADCYVRELRWYRGDVGAPRAPLKLWLWDVTGVAGVYPVTSIPDDGIVGWQTHTVTETVQLVTGKVYAVSWVTKVSGYSSYTGTAPSWTPDPLVSFNNPCFEAATGVDVCPNRDTNNSFLSGVDVTVDLASPPGEAPPTLGQIDESIASWLSSDAAVNTHETDGLPWLTKADTAAIRTTTNNISAQTVDWAVGLGAAAHGYYELMRGLLQTVKDNVDDLPDVIQAIVDVMVDHLDSEIGTILAAIDDILSQLGAQSTDLSGTAGSAVGAISGRTGFPDTGWSMSAETDFSDNVLFDEPADAYVLTITSYQPTQPATETAAGLWLYRLGWWCVMNGSLATQRQFVDFQQMLLTDQGRRMPACAIELKPGTIGHVQAWLLA